MENGTSFNGTAPTSGGRPSALQETLVHCSPFAVWGLGLFSVTVVSFCAVIGIALMPLVSKKFYRRSLTLMVGLGVGTLSGSAVFHLLPQAFGLGEYDLEHTYLTKSWIALAGIYLFYFTDKIIKGDFFTNECIIVSSKAHHSKAASTPNNNQTSDIHSGWVHFSDQRHGAAQHSAQSDSPLRRVFATFGSKGGHGHSHQNPDNPNCICPDVTCICVRDPDGLEIQTIPLRHSDGHLDTSPQPDIEMDQFPVDDDTNEAENLSPDQSSAQLLHQGGNDVEMGAEAACVVPPAMERLSVRAASPAPSDASDATSAALHDQQAHAMCNHDHDLQWQKGDSVIGTVAWMIVFGDGLHNFIDGVSIGAAYSTSILSGVSVTVAVACEEFPHELGDVAILVAAGMTLRQALTYNVLSALTCYVGFVVGVLVGELADLSLYVFALAGGMFLYISLASMIPELNATMERQLARSRRKALVTFLLQSVGVLSGLTLMYVMTLYGGYIDFDRLLAGAG